MIPLNKVKDLISRHVSLEAELSSGKIDKKLYRPSEVKSLLGDCRKAKKELKWKQKFTFKKLVEDMVKSDLDFVKKQGY